MTTAQRTSITSPAAGLHVFDTNTNSAWFFDGSYWISYATQQTVVSSLGLSGNLPDATDAYLVQNGGAIASVTGTNTTTLTQANLPNTTFTGTSSNAGSHTHVVDPTAIANSLKINGTRNQKTKLIIFPIFFLLATR